jgi:hypothetical protein
MLPRAYRAPRRALHDGWLSAPQTHTAPAALTLLCQIPSSAAVVQCPLTQAMADLMEQRAEHRGWAEDGMLSPDREGCAAMEEFLFWVGILHRWACALWNSSSHFSHFRHGLSGWWA